MHAHVQHGLCREENPRKEKERQKGVLNTSKTSSSPLPSSFATGLTSSRDSSSIVAKELVSDDSDDEDVEYKGHFCSECSIPPPGGVRGRVRGYGGVGLWEAGPGCACCENYD